MENFLNLIIEQNINGRQTNNVTGKKNNFTKRTNKPLRLIYIEVLQGTISATQ